MKYKGYLIQFNLREYTYRSYMACEDHGEDDCKGYTTEYVIYTKHNIRLKKAFDTYRAARAYIRTLKKAVTK